MNGRERLIAIAAVLVLRALAAAAESLADWIERIVGDDPGPEPDPEP